MKHPNTFIQLSEPRSFRRAILGSALNSTSLLKQLESYKKIKKLKQKKITELKKILEETKQLVSDLKSKDLPVIEIKQPKIVRKVEKVEKGKPKKVKKAPVIKKKEVDKLDAELRAIQDKLASIKI